MLTVKQDLKMKNFPVMKVVKSLKKEKFLKIYKKIKKYILTLLF